MDSQRYIVKIVFRGLCLARKRPDDGLEFFLPDASVVPQPTDGDAKTDPRKRVLRAIGRFREHHAVLEFLQAEWENQSSIMNNLVQVTKPTKEPVALYLLEKQRIHFRGLYVHTGAAPELPVDLVADPTRYARLGDLFLLSKHDEHGFDQLPSYLCEGAEDALDDTAATTFLKVGEALTERRSRRAGRDLIWREVRVSDGAELQSPRALNLDIVVRFTLPLWNPLRITCEPIKGRKPGDERTFLLRPSDPAKGVTVWVKNRELPAILLDSDALPDPYEAPCPFLDTKDRDHALYVLLAKHPDRLTLPELATGDASDCGSGCGCTEHKP